MASATGPACGEAFVPMGLSQMQALTSTVEGSIWRPQGRVHEDMSRRTVLALVHVCGN